jgi:hypothetical protein
MQVKTKDNVFDLFFKDGDRTHSLKQPLELEALIFNYLVDKTKPLTDVDDLFFTWQCVNIRTFEACLDGKN